MPVDLDCTPLNVFRNTSHLDYTPLNFLEMPVDLDYDPLNVFRNASYSRLYSSKVQYHL